MIEFNIHAYSMSEQGKHGDQAGRVSFALPCHFAGARAAYGAHLSVSLASDTNVPTARVGRSPLAATQGSGGHPSGHINSSLDAREGLGRWERSRRRLLVPVRVLPEVKFPAPVPVTYYRTRSTAGAHHRFLE